MQEESADIDQTESADIDANSAMGTSEPVKEEEDYDGMQDRIP